MTASLQRHVREQGDDNSTAQVRHRQNERPYSETFMCSINSVSVFTWAQVFMKHGHTTFSPDFFFY